MKSNRESTETVSTAYTAPPSNSPLQSPGSQSHRSTMNSNPENGFTIIYSGKQFSPAHNTTKDEKKKTGLDQLRSNFGEMGSLGMRFHLGQGQRAGLLGQITRYNYDKYPVEYVAQGDNQSDLFTVNENETLTYKTTRKLEEISLYSLGRGRVLNERSQPQINKNTQTRGELEMFDIMHAPLWNTGRSVAYHLNQQGFIYVAHPKDMSENQYEIITQELNQGKFDIQESNDGNITIKTSSGMTLETTSLTKLKVEIDPTFKKTYQKTNALVVNGAPHGWILHKVQKKVVIGEHAEDITTIIREAEGGFYKLSEKQQPFLRPRIINFKTPESLFTQNIAFNALQIIFNKLEPDFKFDSSGLFSEMTLNSTYKKMQDLTTQTDSVDDFLTGILNTEILQHLMMTQSNSPRAALPLRFNNSFMATQNNAKAIAYAFELQRKDKRPALEFKEGETRITEEKGLLDFRVKGRLNDPILSNPKNIASLLSTCILVSEQIILEQLLRDACKHGDTHPNAQALKLILANNHLGDSTSEYKELVALASTLPSDASGPKLGLQFPYCETLIQKLRKILNLHHQKSFLENIIGSSRELIDLADELYQTDEKSVVTKMAVIQNDSNVAKGLKNLFFIGKTLQDLKGISVRSEQSRGINAGLIPVIQKLAPALYADLVKNGEIDLAQSLVSAPVILAKSNAHQALANGNIGACPYMRSMQEKSHAKEKPPVTTTATVSSDSAPAPLSVYNNCSKFFKTYAKPFVLTAAATGLLYLTTSKRF